MVQIAYWFITPVAICMSALAGTFLVASPFAALVVAFMARRRGLPMLRYSIVACWCCAAFFVPWIYVVAHLSGWRPAEQIVWASYIVMNILWLVLLVGGYFMFQISYGLNDLAAGRSVEQGLYSPSTFLLAANVVTMLTALGWLTVSHFVRAEPGQTRHDALPRLPYVTPFGLLSFWSMAYVVVYIFVILSG